MGLLHELNDFDLDLSSKVKGRNRKKIDRKDLGQRKEEGFIVQNKNEEIRIRENDAFLYGLLHEYRETEFYELVSGIIAKYKQISDPSFDKEEIGKMVDEAVEEADFDPEVASYLDWEASGEQRSLRSEEELREIHETEPFGHHEEDKSDPREFS